MGDTSSYLMGMGSDPNDYRVPSAVNGQVNNYVTSGIAGVQGRTAPTLNDQLQAQFRQRQMQQIGQLQGIASGQQPGAGELAVQRQVANSLAANQGQARMSRGGDVGMANLGAARNAAGIGISGAGMGQQAAMTDQMNAQQMLTGALGQGRNQDIQMAQGNVEAQLRAQGMNDQQIMAYLQQMNQQGQAELGAQASMYGAGQQNHGMMGGLVSGIGSGLAALAMSDERVKEDITDAGDEVDEMLEKLLPKAYVYKDQSRHGIGRRVGIMAQDLERSKAGARVVREVPDGKAIDINKAVSASLASVARLHARLRTLESKAG